MQDKKIIMISVAIIAAILLIVFIFTGTTMQESNSQQ